MIVHMQSNLKWSRYNVSDLPAHLTSGVPVPYANLPTYLYNRIHNVYLNT